MSHDPFYSLIDLTYTNSLSSSPIEEEQKVSLEVSGLNLSPISNSREDLNPELNKVYLELLERRRSLEEKYTESNQELTNLMSFYRNQISDNEQLKKNITESKKTFEKLQLTVHELSHYSLKQDLHIQDLERKIKQANQKREDLSDLNRSYKHILQETPLLELKLDSLNRRKEYYHHEMPKLESINKKLLEKSAMLQLKMTKKEMKFKELTANVDRVIIRTQHELNIKNSLNKYLSDELFLLRSKPVSIQMTKSTQTHQGSQKQLARNKSVPRKRTVSRNRRILNQTASSKFKQKVLI